MLRWALMFFVIAIIAGIFGFTDIAASAAFVARILFGLFLFVCLVLLALGLFAAGFFSR